MDKRFIYYLLLYIGIKDPEDYIDTIPKDAMDRLISQLTLEEIDEILITMNNHDH